MEAQSKPTFKVVHIQDGKGFKQMHNIPEQLDGASLWNDDGSIGTLTYEQTCKPSIVADYYNGFFSAFLNAYNRQGDVKITPDDVWLVIMLYFSKYVNNNSQKLRNAFVSHAEKKKLTVVTEDELSESQWDEFFDKVIDAIKKNTTEGVTEKFQCNFTTTTRVEKILSTSVIMNVYKKYFDFERCIPECGIQNVHFGGTLDDWQKLREKIQVFNTYDVNGELKKYVSHLDKILAKFVETYEGKVDVEFWNKVLHINGPMGSGFNYSFNGWILHFFGIYESTEDVDLECIDFQIVIDNKITGIIRPVEFMGGFRAVSIEGEKGNVFRPHISMAIIEKVETKKNYQEQRPDFISLFRYDRPDKKN